MFHHRYTLVSLLISIWFSSLGFAADGTDKVDIDKDKLVLSQITISRQSSGEVSSWEEKLGTFFPDTKQIYHVTIDLNNLETVTLSNLNRFFLHLASKQNFMSQISYLTLTNGTSYRFNLIKEGVINLLKQKPEMQFEYFHKGIQSPSSPAKTLRSAAFVRGCTLETSSPGHFIVRPVESDSEQSEAVINGDLTPRIQSYEKESKLESLKVQFSSIEERNGFSSWPPFGITNKNQVMEIYSGDIPHFVAYGDFKPVFVTLTGMASRNMEPLHQFCKSNSSIKALKFITSALMPEDLEPILPLIGTQLQMLDISEAFKLDDKNIWPKLTEFLDSKDQSSLINHFMLKGITPIKDPHQKVMSIMSDYVSTIAKNGDSH